MAAGVLALLAVASNLGEADRRGDAGPAGLGDPVRDGQFEFVVGSVDCGARSVGEGLGRKQALEQFCLVELEVENTGTEGRTFGGGQQYLFDGAGNRHDPDLDATVRHGDGRLVSTHLNPGQRLEGTLVYDVPDPIDLARVELHDAALQRRGQRRPGLTGPRDLGTRLPAGGDHGHGQGDREQVLQAAEQGPGEPVRSAANARARAPPKAPAPAPATPRRAPRARGLAGVVVDRRPHGGPGGQPLAERGPASSGRGRRQLVGDHLAGGRHQRGPHRLRRGEPAGQPPRTRVEAALLGLDGQQGDRDLGADPGDEPEQHRPGGRGQGRQHGGDPVHGGSLGSGVQDGSGYGRGPGLLVLLGGQRPGHVLQRLAGRPTPMNHSATPAAIISTAPSGSRRRR